MPNPTDEEVEVLHAQAGVLIHLLHHLGHRKGDGISVCVCACVCACGCMCVCMCTYVYVCA